MTRNITHSAQKEPLDNMHDIIPNMVRPLRSRPQRREGRVDGIWRWLGWDCWLHVMGAFGMLAVSDGGRRSDAYALVLERLRSRVRSVLIALCVRPPPIRESTGATWGW